ncbi:unnamed protein product [Protopolystoma xenopodis]|uniref:Uncharacterized protein n=1 Tax=Protopolystoma xenopodis TaxID=117903 RepID=A0A3S5B3Q0_9PLAT|nr:unnamed protein product [Protopolystoma xenopodis]
MVILTDDTDYDASEALRIYQVHCLMLEIMTTTMADDFGLELNASDLAATNSVENYNTVLLELLRNSALMRTASPAEVAARRQRWLSLPSRLAGVTSWPNFSRVFMLSSATGRGVSDLRDYLLSRAKPVVTFPYPPCLVTEHDSPTLVSMCLRAVCLESLTHPGMEDVAYRLRFAVDECETGPRSLFLQGTPKYSSSETSSDNEIGDELENTASLIACVKQGNINGEAKDLETFKSQSSEDVVFVRAKILCQTERHLVRSFDIFFRYLT